MFCIKCGAENDDSNLFCIKCGAPLPKPEGAEKKPQQPAPAAKPQQAQDVPDLPPQPPVQPQAPAQVPAQTPAQQPAQPGVPQGVNDAADNAKAFAANAASAFNQQVPGFGELIKLGFKDPIGAIKYGKEHKLAKEGLLIFLIKDFIIAVLAIFQSHSAMSQVSGVLPVSNPLSGGGGIKAFFIMLILMLAIDAICCFIMYGICKAFGGKSDLSSWLGALGGVNVLTGTCTIVSSLFGVINLPFISILVTLFAAIVGVVLDIKLVEDCMDLHNNRLIYSIVVSVVLIAIAVLIVVAIIGAAVGAAAFSSGLNQLNELSEYSDYGY